MEAVIVTQKVYEGVLDYVHGGGRVIKRLVFPDADNLALTPDGEKVYAFTGFNLNEAEIVGKTQVADEIVAAGLDAARTQQYLDSLKESIRACIP